MLLFIFFDCGRVLQCTYVLVHALLFCLHKHPFPAAVGILVLSCPSSTSSKHVFPPLLIGQPPSRRSSLADVPCWTPNRAGMNVGTSARVPTCAIYLGTYHQLSRYLPYLPDQVQILSSKYLPKHIVKEECDYFPLAIHATIRSTHLASPVRL